MNTASWLAVSIVVSLSKKETPEALKIKGSGRIVIIPTRCRDLNLKQFCLEDIAPATLIILITHIVLAVRWMLIKILSAVINHHGRVNTVVSGGCHPNNNIIRKIDLKIKKLRRFPNKNF